MVTSCLDDETMLGLAEGRLAAATLASAEDHLDGCATCRDVLSQFACASSPSHVLERGHTIGIGGRYVIGELLGSGAMGHVYSAWQPELDRRVAIKVLRDDAAHGRDRLIREAQSMARLDHPNVVGVHEVGSLDDGGVFVVMDLIEGDTLRLWAESPREPRELVRVLAEIARGLAAVHATGVVHRDIKPDNIIVGADGRARLGDFGLARGAGTKNSGRLADSVSFEDTIVATPRGSSTARRSGSHDPSPAAATSFGAVSAGVGVGSRVTSIAGTPVYMAPEILRGGSATAASDQFAFGVTAYEIIAGKRPFSGGTWAALAKAVETPPPQLRAMPLARHLPGWLDDAIRRCLAVDPARRFASLAAVADHLAERVQRRRPTAWIAGATIAVALGVGVTWIAVRGNSSPAGPSCTLGAAEIETTWNPRVRDQLASLGAPTLAAIDGWTTRWAAEHDAVCTAATVDPAPKIAARQQCLVRQRTELAALLTRASSPQPDPKTSESSPIADRMVDAIAALSPDDCRLAEPGTADPIPADPDRAKAVRDVEKSLPAVRAAISLGDARPVVDSMRGWVARAQESGHAPTLAEALLVRADALRATAQLADAALAARDALVAAERGHDDQLAARAWVSRVALATDRRDLAVADDFAAIAAAVIERAGSPRRLAAQLVRLRAQIAYNRGRYDQATMLLEDAGARFVKLSGERSVDVVEIESLLGTAARAAGDLEGAERHHRAALAIDRGLRGAIHPAVARDLHNLAGVLRLRGDLDAALTTYNEALAIENATRGEHSVEAGLTHNSLGLIAIARKDFVVAKSELLLARDALTSANHGDRAFAEHNLGIVAAATGDHLGALADFDRAAAIFDATLGADAASSIRIHLDRARSLAALGRRDASRAEATKAIELATRAEIPWIADDARVLLTSAPAARPRPGVTVAVEPPPAGPDIPVTQPTRVADPPVPQPPKPPVEPKPKPRRDVGSYGAAQP